MVKVEISEELASKIRAFKKVIDAVMSEELEEESGYVESILQIGLERMFQDVLPKEEPIALRAFIQMFNLNPEFICKFIAESMKKGEAIQAQQAKKEWSQTLEQFVV